MEETRVCHGGFEGVAAPPNHTEEVAPHVKAAQDTPGTDANAKTVLSRKTFACLAAADTVKGVALTFLCGSVALLLMKRLPTPSIRGTPQNDDHKWAQ